jgi:hypothetical protein
MTAFELDAVLDSYYNNHKKELENLRFLAYTFTAPYSSKKDFKPTDIMTFDWDKEIIENKSIEEVKDQANKFLLNLQNSKKK